MATYLRSGSGKGKQQNADANIRNTKSVTQQPMNSTPNAETMYPTRFPRSYTTAVNDYEDLYSGPQSVRGRKVSQGSADRGGGRIVPPGTTHGTAQRGLKRYK